MASFGKFLGFWQSWIKIQWLAKFVDVNCCHDFFESIGGYYRPCCQNVYVLVIYTCYTTMTLTISQA
jgi:hypothetical protein